ncbi:uncharacterized protein LOC106165010 [Lingula anatina]|uniref:Uncharacterized protein LOC106165010 n=1 Tax=Lingula anatina TaxID=7574 RepID=A0A1S3IJZ6_LINAN|nr:uncharacterized protein LOC106165010 [Lingula anatina]|eukprot:XP_013398532.1 uncharacterized protein LOC106165010 [Lingula anatina]
MSCFEPLTNRFTNALRIARGRVGNAYQYVRQRLRRRRPRVGVDPQGTPPPVRPQQGRLSKFKDELSNKRTLKKAGLQTVGKPQEGASGTAWEVVDKDARPKTAMPKRLARPTTAMRKDAEELKKREEAAIERRRESMVQHAAAIRKKLGKAADVIFFFMN